MCMTAIMKHRWQVFLRQSRRYLLIFVCLISLADIVAAEPDKVVLLMREQRNESGDIIPIRENVRHVLSYLEQQVHIQFEIHRYPLPRILVNVKNGEGIVFGLSKNSERLAQYVFSEPVYANTVWLVKRGDDRSTFDTLNDLKGKTIGKRMDMMLVSTYLSQPADVDFYLRQMIRSDDTTDEKTMQTGFSVLKKPLMKDELHFATAPGDSEKWIVKLNRAIIAGKKSGEISRLLNAPMK